MSKTIEITNVGPIEHLSLPVPEAGGIVVLRGRNGAGKTKSLDAVESLVSGRGNIDVRDGELRGSVDGLGVTITVGRRTTRRGELEALSLEGRLSVASLVNPEIADPSAADAKRIKALVALSGAKADPSVFHPLLGGKGAFDELVTEDDVAGDDIVAMAGRIKRRLEAYARTLEGQAEHAQGRASAARESAAGVDVAGTIDSASLQSALESAVREESRLKADAETARRIEEQARLARTELSLAESNYAGDTIEATEQAAKLTRGDLEAAQRTWTAAQESVRTAKAQYDSAFAAHELAKHKESAARQHAAAIDGWRKTLAAAEATPQVDAEALAAAQDKVRAARQAIEQGALARKALEQLKAADQAADQHAKLEKRAAEIRQAAQGTDDVLSVVVSKAGFPLTVEAGRLVTRTKRGKTYFGDLSQGERWKIGLDIAIHSVGAGGIIVIPQEAWESLDPSNRQLIAKHVNGKGVTVLTAEASDDSVVTAEVFG